MISDCETTQVVVKNTFIEHVLPKPKQRRCESVPSSVRLNNGRDKATDQEIAQLVKGCFSDASTDPGATSDEESVDSAPTNLSTSQNTWAPECATQVEMPQGQQVMLVTPQDYSVEPVMTFYTQPVEKAKLNSQAEAYEPKVTRLNTEAKVFTPGCCLRQKPPGTKLNANARKRCARFRWQCQEVIMAAKEALERCGFVQSVEVLTEKSNWTVDAYVRPEYFQCKEQALSKAKQALLDSAENSQGVYVMGYRSKPFMTTPDGFFVLLGVMTCIKEACWESFCYGYCGNEDTCTMQHPVYQVPVYINIKFEAGY